MALRRLSVAVAMAVWLAAPASAPAASANEPSFGHGVGQVIAGILFELPKTVLGATLDGPPVVGTMVGLLAGTAGAVQKTVGGIVEMAQAFDPWGTKKR
jgi:hypothetical protein